MIEKAAQKIYTYMSRHNEVDAELEDVYKYGIEITISSALNIILVMTISFILKSPLSGVCHLCCLFSLRSFCGGYHADSYFKCNSLMVLFFALSYAAAKLLIYYNLTDIHLTSPFLMLAFLPIYAFAPVKNKHKPLTESRAKKCRTLSIIIFIALSLLGIYLSYFGILYGHIIIVTLIEISGSVIFETLKKGGKAMKFHKAVAKVIEKASIAMAKKAGGAASANGWYQPKEPKALEKLMK